MSRAQILITNTSWVYVNKLVAQTMQLAVAILIARELMVKDFGSFNFMVATVTVFGLFGTSAVCGVFNRYIPDLYYARDFSHLRKLVVGGACAALIIVGMMVSGFLCLQNTFASLFHMEVIKDYRLLFIIYLVFSLVGNVTDAAVTSLLLHKAFALVSIVRAVLRTGAYYVFIPWLSVRIMLAIEGAGIAFSVIASTLVLLHYNHIALQNGESNPSPFRWSKVIRFGTLSAANELGGGIVGKLSDYYIISAMSDAYHVGLYAFAFRIFAAVQGILPLKNFLTVVRPLFIQKFSRGKTKEEFVQIYNLIVKTMLPVYLFPTLYFLLFGEAVIRLVFSPKYMPAFSVTNIVLLGNVVTAVFYPLGLTIQLIERMEFALYSKGVAVFSIVAGILAMQYWGIVGVALVTVCGELFKNLIMYWLAHRHADVVYRFHEYLPVGVHICMILALFFLTRQLIFNLPILIVVSFAFTVFYIISCIVMHPYTGDDLQMIRRLAKANGILQHIAPHVLKIHSVRIWLGRSAKCFAIPEPVFTVSYPRPTAESFVSKGR